MPMRSPNEFMKAGKRLMLDGREPSSEDDWVQLVNFLAANIAEGLEASACKLFKMLYKIPLTDDDIAEIAEFQRARK